MAYNKFKRLEDLQKTLAINETQDAWLPTNLQPVKVGDWLLDYLKDAANEALGSEKAKSEYVIAPILRELRRQNPDRFSTFSGYQFDVDATRGLTGFCDFILAAAPKKAKITAPIFCLVEAKNDNIDKGIAQCGAEMYAAQIYNQREGNDRPVIYGAVTTAFLWCFLKLEGKELTIDPNFVPLTFAEPHRVLTVLQWILDKSI